MKPRLLLASAAASLLAIQLVPYGRAHQNPPGRTEPPWDAQATRDLARRACFDCHSNETQWPWYSHVAPVSWLVQRDVETGRSKLNFQQWDHPQREAHDAAEEVTEGEMPMPIYLILHGEARLSDAERETLADGLSRTLGSEKGGRTRAEHDAGEHDDD